MFKVKKRLVPQLLFMSMICFRQLCHLNAAAEFVCTIRNALFHSALFKVQSLDGSPLCARSSICLVRFSAPGRESTPLTFLSEPQMTSKTHILSIAHSFFTQSCCFSEIQPRSSLNSDCVNHSSPWLAKVCPGGTVQSRTAKVGPAQIQTYTGCACLQRDRGTIEPFKSTHKDNMIVGSF